MNHIKEQMIYGVLVFTLAALPGLIFGYVTTWEQGWVLGAFLVGVPMVWPALFIAAYIMLWVESLNNGGVRTQ